MELIISKKFKKQAQKLVENKSSLRSKINECLIDFSKNAKKSKYYRKQLNRKQLKGNLYGYDELQIGGDIRIIIRINKDQSSAVLVMIGSHSQFGL